MTSESVNTRNNILSNETSCHYSLVYAYTFLFLVFSFYFYELIAIDPLDEFFEVLLVFIAFVYLYEGKYLTPKKDLIIFLCVALFYLIYSFIIHSNSAKGILIDTSVQLKPYIAFFVFYYLGVHFSFTKKKLLRFVLIGLFCVSLLVTIVGLSIGDLVGAMKLVFHHPARFASALVILSLYYLYTTDYKRKNVIFFILMISLALFSGKAKTFGFYAAALFTLFVFYYKIKLKFDVKTVFLIVLLISLIIIAAWDKFFFYFVNYSMDDEESLARPFLYYTSFFIFIDYFPFGSGLASFGTAASGSSYSDIYYQYDLNGIWGLNPDYPFFVSDTYYPSLAQFGVFGLILFVSFWVRIIREALFYRKKTEDRKNFMIIILVMMFFAIEFIADATFTNNRGFAAMILIALCLNEMKLKYESTSLLKDKPGTDEKIELSEVLIEKKDDL